MLELPECASLARQINERLSGKRIVGTIAAQSPHKFTWYFGEPEEYAHRLNGCVFANARQSGGYIVCALKDSPEGDVCLTLQDGVNIRLYEKDEKLPPKHQLLLEIEDGSSLVFSVRMYGAILAYPDGALDNEYFTAAESCPSPLSDGFTPEYFASIVKACKPNVSAKALLATKQRIPGLGNGCLQDILFNAGVSPRRRIMDMDEQTLARLYRAVVDTLSVMTSCGGRDTETDLNGKPGGYKTLLSSKTVDSPCPVCSGALRKENYMGGSVYICENCQK